MRRLLGGGDAESIGRLRAVFNHPREGELANFRFEQNEKNLSFPSRALTGVRTRRE
jgi:hypothetical protein